MLLVYLPKGPKHEAVRLGNLSHFHPKSIPPLPAKGDGGLQVSCVSSLGLIVRQGDQRGQSVQSHCALPLGPRSSEPVFTECSLWERPESLVHSVFTATQVVGADKTKEETGEFV